MQVHGPPPLHAAAPVSPPLSGGAHGGPGGGGGNTAMTVFRGRASYGASPRSSSAFELPPAGALGYSLSPVHTCSPPKPNQTLSRQLGPAFNGRQPPP